MFSFVPFSVFVVEKITRSSPILFPVRLHVAVASSPVKPPTAFACALPSIVTSQRKWSSFGDEPGDTFFIGVKATVRAYCVLLAKELPNRTIYDALLPSAASRSSCCLHQGVHLGERKTKKLRQLISFKQW